jgi:hypothetical protein
MASITSFVQGYPLLMTEENEKYAIRTVLVLLLIVCVRMYDSKRMIFDRCDVVRNI